jgi:hypothetical protein
MKKAACMKEIISGTVQGTGQAPGLIHFMSGTGGSLPDPTDLDPDTGIPFKNTRRVEDIISIS